MHGTLTFPKLDMSAPGCAQEDTRQFSEIWRTSKSGDPKGLHYFHHNFGNLVIQFITGLLPTCQILLSRVS